MKKTITWWVGWIVLFPARLAWALVVAIVMACIPQIWYKIAYSTLDPRYKNPDNWK